MERIRVVLADDHAFLRTSIRKILDKTPDIIVVGEAGDGVQALDMVKALSPDVLVLDVEMPHLNGIQVARQLNAEGSDVRVLALSAYDDRAHIRGMLDVGVAGYLTKDEASEVLVKAVRGVAEGKDGWFSQRAAAKVATEKRKMEPREMSWSERELKFLRCLAEGKTDKEIIAEMNLQEGALERFLQIISMKLGATSRQEVVKLARHSGML